MQHAAVLVLTGLWVPARLEAAAGPRWGLMRLLMQRHLELQWRLVADRFVRDSSAGHRDLSPTDVDKRCRDKDAAAPNERDIASGATVEFKSTSASSHRRREKVVTNP